MINNLFDKKTAEYEFLCASTELPFRTVDVQIGANEQGTLINSQSINDIFNHLVDNDLYNEQLIINLSTNRNVAGASITGISSDIINYSQDGQKFVLTSNAEPEVQIVKRITSDANTNVQEIEDLRGRRINFILDESQKYVVGTDIGLFCSDNRLSGWRRVKETDYFHDPFEDDYDCRCCIRNIYQGTFKNELDKYQYFLGTSNGVFGLDNSDYFNDHVFWDKIAAYTDDAAILDNAKINSLALDPHEKVLLVGTEGENAGIFRTDDTYVKKEINADFNVNDIEILNSENLLAKNEYILAATSEGIRQSTEKYFMSNVTKEHQFASNEKITVLGINGNLKYIGTDKHLYNTSYNVITSIEGASSGNVHVFAIDFLRLNDANSYEFAVFGIGSNSNVFYRSTTSEPSSWVKFQAFSSINNVVGVNIIDNTVIMATTNTGDVYYVQYIVDDFRDVVHVPKPLLPYENRTVNKVGNNNTYGYVSTDKGINVYDFERTDPVKKIFKFQNNLSNRSIDKVFEAHGSIFIVSGNSVFYKNATLKFDNYDEIEYEFSSEIKNIAYYSQLNGYLFFTSNGLFITNNLNTFSEIKYGSNHILSITFITHRNSLNVLFSTDDNKVYYCPLDKFNASISSSDTSIECLMSNVEGLLNLYSTTEPTCIDGLFLKSNNTDSLCQFIILDEMRKNQDIYSIKDNLGINDTVTSSLETYDSQTQTTVEEIYSRLNSYNGKNYFAYHTENVNAIYFLDIASEKLCTPVFWYDTQNKQSGIKLEEYASKAYVFSNPFVDINYLRNVLFLGQNSKSSIYGVFKNYNILEYYPDPEDPKKLPYNDNYDYFNDADSSYKVYADSNIYKGIISFAGQNKIIGLKIGYQENYLNNFSTNVNSHPEYHEDLPGWQPFNKVVNGLDTSTSITDAIYCPLENNDNVFYCANNGVYGFRFTSKYFSGIKLVSNEILNKLQVVDNEYFAIDQNSKIIKSNNLTAWTQVNSSLSGNCTDIFETMAKKNIRLVDSIQSDVSIQYPININAFVVLINGNVYICNNEFSSIGNLNKEIIDVSDYDFAIGNVKAIGKLNDNILIAYYDQTSQKSTMKILKNIVFNVDFSSIDFDLIDLKLSNAEESITLDFEIDKFVIDEYRNNVFVFGKDSNNNSELNWYSLIENELDQKELDIVFDSIVIDSSKNIPVVYASKKETVNSIYLFNINKFIKIFETQSTGLLKNVHEISSISEDIFNEKLLFTYDNGNAYMVAVSINHTSKKEIDSSFSASKVASYLLDDFDIVAAQSNTVLKIYSIPADIFDSSNATTILNESNAFPGKTMVDLTMQKMDDGNDYLLILLKDSSNTYSMKRMKLYVDSLGQNKEIKVDKNPDIYYDCFISALIMPEGINSIPSFAQYYSNSDPNSQNIHNTVYFSTNKGIAYLKCDEISQPFRVFELISSGKNPVTGLPNENYFEQGNSLITSSNKKLWKVDKTELTKTEKTIPSSSSFDKLLGIRGELQSIVYGKSLSGTALSANNMLNWNSTSIPSFSSMDYINSVPMNTMYVGNTLEDSFFGSDSGMYNLQEYVPMTLCNSYNIMSTFNVNCVEFADNDPIFSMNMVCLDLEFNYISSSIDDLTRETFNKVLDISKITDKDIAIVEKDAIQIYDLELSQLIDLNLLEFKEKNIVPSIYTMSPIGVSTTKTRLQAGFSISSDVYLAVNNNTLVKFHSWRKRRVFDICKGKYKILERKFRNDYVNEIYSFDADNLLIGLRPPDNEEVYIDHPFYSVHFIKNLRMDIALNDENGDQISGDSRVFETVVSDISHGYATKYLFSAGNELYRTFNRAFSDTEVDKISADKIITSLFTERDAMYLIGTTAGLFATTPEYRLDDEMTKWNMDSVPRLMEDLLKLEVEKHLERMHEGNNIACQFISALNTRSTTSPEKLPSWFTSKSEQMSYNSIMKVSSDMVVDMEFNDENKYIRGSVRNWITELYGGESTYSESDYVDQMTDPIDKTLIDFSDLTYVCKNWNSGMKEILVYVPTTMTYYINNPKGFSNSRYSDAAIPRKNAKGTTTSNVISEKCTHYQLILNNKHFGIKNICMVQINGNSLPLRMYRDDTYCQQNRENLFDTVIQPSVVNSLPVIPNEDVNNISYMTDSSGYLRINFSIYGTDAQSIRILAN